MTWNRLVLKYSRSLAVVLALSVCSNSASAVVYTNVRGTVAAGKSGISHVQYSGSIVSSGVVRTGGSAAADYDNDGWVDLFVTRLNARPLLYRNLGNGTFQDVAVSAGFTASLPANGTAWGDIDNDGDKDLYITSTSGTRYYMYVNNGDGTFDEKAVERGADIGGALRFGQSVTFGDYDRDGYLDIHTTDWGYDVSVSTSRLLRNLGGDNPASAGYFEDVTVAAGLNVYRPSHFFGGGTDTIGYRHTSTFSDLDRDGYPDLAIASDFKTSQLFWNNGDGTFTDGTIAAGVGTDEDGMGSTIGDFDGDGQLDWFITNLVDVPGQTEDHSGNRLYRNNGDRTFEDQSDHTEFGGVWDSGWSWGTTFLDHDNDRDLDLFVTNGWNPGAPFPDQSHIYQNDNGVFTDVSNASGVTDTGQGRGLLSFDYDNDGDLDVFIANHGAQPILYRNDGGNENDWLKIKVEGTASNRDGIGAFITVDPDATIVGDEIVREITGGSNYLSQNDLTAHFGLGPDSETIDFISIQWPSGWVQELSNVSVNQVLNLVETPGDFNQNGIVDGRDFLIWQQSFGITETAVVGQGDANGDRNVNATDLAIWQENYGVGGAPLAAIEAIPEPSAGLLALVSSLLLAMTLRRP